MRDEREERDEEDGRVEREPIRQGRDLRERWQESEPVSPRPPEPKDEAEGSTVPDGGGSLFAEEEAQELRRRWSEVQAQFVDDPRSAVRAADGLVEEVLRHLGSLFEDERSRSDEKLGPDGAGDTEHLRHAVRRYRAFFDRLLSV